MLQNKVICFIDSITLDSSATVFDPHEVNAQASAKPRRMQTYGKLEIGL